MALIVEDGTGKSDAESYTDITFADGYHSDRANVAWSTLNTQIKEACLRKATEYLVGVYRLRWKGRRVTVTQALDWPRNSVALLDVGGTPAFVSFEFSYLASSQYLAHDVVPLEVKKACAELALRASTGPLVADLKQKVTEKQVGPITVKYQPYSPQYVRYPQIDQLLDAYVDSGSDGINAKLVRG